MSQPISVVVPVYDGVTGAFPICDIRGWTSFPRCATTTLGWMRLEGFAASG